MSTAAPQAFEPAEPRSPLARSLAHLTSLQRPDGAFEGEVEWNPMLLSQVVIVRTILAGKSPFDEATKRKIVRHFEANQNKDGGFGMHAESGSYVFFTALSYVALRMLGLGPDAPIAASARGFLRAERGRVLGIPTWGKMWLALLGLYDYAGVNPVPPELFLLPSALPFHPDRYYCHTRYIYLGMAYLYGRRFQADLGPLRAELRRELHEAPYTIIDFSAHRHRLGDTDLHVRPGPALRLAYDALAATEKLVPRALRDRALARCLDRIVYEQRATRYEGLSPVNGLLDCLALFAADPAHPDLAPSVQGIEAWRWDDEDLGLRYAGARSQTWDTAFAMRAALEAPAAERPRAALLRAYAYLRGAQVRDDLPGRAAEHRDPVLGGFCFSDGKHRWPVSDCTAEALSSILALHEEPGLAPRGSDRFEDRWLTEAGRFLLTRQNDDGGFGTYERRRGGPWLEALNPSEMFGSCMTERSYIECTASAIAALSRLLRATGEAGTPLATGSDRRRFEAAKKRAERFLRRAQRPDGAWQGFWGVCFTYATFHAVEALVEAGATPRDNALVRARRFLLGIQKSDGGWGEHFQSGLGDRYVEHPESQVVMSAWALLALLAAGEPRTSRAVQRGLSFLRSMQRPDGSFPRQSPAGVFFGTAMLEYRLYKDYFPAWALARAAAQR
ncbi:MAG: prenyltransferase/squalene oxidase repeat-containing protein [Byssovorax sp.]